MAFKLSRRSKNKLHKVHPALVAVVEKAIEITDVDFGIADGARTMEDQKERVRTGSSQTLKGRHVPENNESGYSCAVDVFAWVGNEARYEWIWYERIAKAMFKAAIELGVDLEWGGFWVYPKDGVHFQLSRKEFP